MGLHDRTEKHFNALIGRVSCDDTRALLEGMKWLGFLVEELNDGMQKRSERVEQASRESLTKMCDKAGGQT